MSIDFYIDDENDNEDTIVDCDLNDCISGHEDHDQNICNIRVG